MSARWVTMRCLVDETDKKAMSARFYCDNRLGLKGKQKHLKYNCKNIKTYHLQGM